MIGGVAHLMASRSPDVSIVLSSITRLRKQTSDFRFSYDCFHRNSNVKGAQSEILLPAHVLQFSFTFPIVAPILGMAL
jgi:hypothetical protein